MLQHTKNIFFANLTKKRCNFDSFTWQLLCLAVAIFLFDSLRERGQCPWLNSQVLQELKVLATCLLTALGNCCRHLTSLNFDWIKKRYILSLLKFLPHLWLLTALGASVPSPTSCLLPCLWLLQGKVCVASSSAHQEAWGPLGNSDEEDLLNVLDKPSLPHHTGWWSCNGEGLICSSERTAQACSFISEVGWAWSHADKWKGYPSVSAPTSPFSLQPHSLLEPGPCSGAASFLPGFQFMCL